MKKPRIYNAEKHSLQYVVLGKLDSHLQKNELDYYLKPYTKITQSRLMTTIRPKTIVLLEENIVEDP